MVEVEVDSESGMRIGNSGSRIVGVDSGNGNRSGPKLDYKWHESGVELGSEWARCWVKIDRKRMEICVGVD